MSQSYLHTPFCECTGLTAVTIPNSVTSIGEGAFRDCTGLTSVTLPNSVTSIGGYAFSGCFGLTSVTIPNSITSIDNGTFCRCTGLTSLTIPNSVTSIGERAFYDCSGLTSVTIPNSVTSIGTQAFSGCSGLTSVTFNAKNCTFLSRAGTLCSMFYMCSNLTSLTIGDNVTAIPPCAFGDCSGLTSVTIPNAATSISNKAFAGCSGLISISIPQKVESVGESAFEDCTGLTTVTIDGSEVLLVAETFVGCTNIKTVNALNTLPPIGADNTFELITYRDATLNVPKTAKDAYSKPACWRNFRHVEEKDFGGVDDVTADEGDICVNVRDRQIEVSGADASEEVRVYDMAGMEIYRGTDRTIALPTKGVYIVKVAGRTFKVAR